MRVKMTRAALLLALAALASGGVSPAGATSAYHMNGQGTITIGGVGMPSCLWVVNVPDCANPDNPFSWGNLTVQGAGILQNLNVAGQYQCLSAGTIGTRSFESRIHGNTTNFELTFNFACTRLSGTGPSNINGWFSNVTGAGYGPAYHSVSGHPHPTPSGPGTFSFKGFFRADNTHPYDITNANGDAMSCGGGFAPSTLSGSRITSAAFLGECNAAE